MNTRAALTAKIRMITERIDRLQTKLTADKSLRAELIAQRDALTKDEEARIKALQQAGVVKVQD